MQVSAANPVARGRSWGVVFEAEAEDAGGVDPDDLAGEPGHGRALAGEGFGVAPDLNAADLPGLERDDVVDDERHVGVGGQVTELPAGSHGPPADVDGAEFGVVAARDRSVLPW